MLSLALSQGAPLMTTKKPNKLKLIEQIRSAVTGQPGLSVKDLASRLKVNRQFMAGFLSALEEQGEVYHRQVGPARIYFGAYAGPSRSKDVVADHSKTE